MGRTSGYERARVLDGPEREGCFGNDPDGPIRGKHWHHNPSADRTRSLPMPVARVTHPGERKAKATCIRQKAATSLMAVANPAALALLEQLACGPFQAGHEAEPLWLGLAAAGLVITATDGTSGLTRRGREVWQAVRCLCQ